MAILNALQDYWPLTLRPVFYQLVATLVIENQPRKYKRLSELLTKARLSGLIPWEAIENRARTMLWSPRWPDADVFVRVTLAAFLQGYRRDLLQSQERALEVWVEKDALSRIEVLVGA